MQLRFWKGATLALFVFFVSLVAPRAQAQDARVPSPDFSQMENDYDIIQWTYESSGHLKLVIRPKTAPLHDRKYGFKFFDADGATYDGPQPIFGNGFGTPIGEVERAEAYAPDEGHMRHVKSVIVYQILGDGTLIGPKPQAIPKPAPEKPAKPAPFKPKVAPKTAAKTAAPTEACSFEKQPAPNARMKFSTALVKSLIYERYGFEKETGGLSSPLDVGVKFVSIKMLGSFRNTVTVVPGRGAQRRNDAAPVGTTIYRFHAVYIVCRKYSDLTRRTQYESDNTAFKASNGAWTGGVDSVPQIHDLN